MRVSGLETFDCCSLLIHVLILILSSESIADRIEFRSMINDIILIASRRIWSASVSINSITGTSTRRINHFGSTHLCQRCKITLAIDWIMSIIAFMSIRIVDIRTITVIYLACSERRRSPVRRTRRLIVRIVSSLALSVMKFVVVAFCYLMDS